MLNEQLIKELLGSEELTAKEIIEKGKMENITPQKLARALLKMDFIDVANPGNNRNIYKIVMPIIFTGKIEKNKNILNMELDNGEYLQYDFNTNKFNIEENFKARGVENNIILQIFSNHLYKQLQQTEWLYSYMDLLDDNINNYQEFDFPTCPSGYITWLKNNNLKINSETLQIFTLINKYPNVPIPIMKKYAYENEILKTLDDMWKNCNIDKILRNSIKKYEFDIRYDFHSLISTINKLRMGEIDWFDFIDDNRSLEDNVKKLNNLLQNKENEILSKRLQKLNFINNLQIDDYIVIIPQNIEDLILEGRQQHNCVGYYYNESIQLGKNLIYFIRDVNNIKKSLITCRYNIEMHKTTEHRIKNNCNTNQEQNSIIAQIDKIINEQLGL